MEGRFPQQRKEAEEEGFFITEMKGWGKVFLEQK
jgi:hypothetical protein